MAAAITFSVSCCRVTAFLPPFLRMRPKMPGTGKGKESLSRLCRSGLRPVHPAVQVRAQLGPSGTQPRRKAILLVAVEPEAQRGRALPRQRHVVPRHVDADESVASLEVGQRALCLVAVDEALVEQMLHAAGARLANRFGHQPVVRPLVVDAQLRHDLHDRGGPLVPHHLQVADHLAVDVGAEKRGTLGIGAVLVPDGLERLPVMPEPAPLADRRLVVDRHDPADVGLVVLAGPDDDAAMLSHSWRKAWRGSVSGTRCAKVNRSARGAPRRQSAITSPGSGSRFASTQYSSKTSATRSALPLTMTRLSPARSDGMTALRPRMVISFI